MKHVESSRPPDSVVAEIISAIKNKASFGACGCKATFRYQQETDNAVCLKRLLKGTDTRVSFKTLAKGIEAIRKDHSLYYAKGPGALRKAAGITHVTSPTWALLRSVPLNALL
ncbi:MAG: hypothetical protein ACR2P7_08790 [bacterium]